jgi:hypothetical protein
MAIKVLIGVWDSRKTWNIHDSLADLMLNTTLKFSKTVLTQSNDEISCIDTVPFDDLNSIFDLVDNYNYTHFLLVTSGCMIKNPARFLLGLKLQIQNNPGMCVSGQILHTGLWPSVNNLEFYTMHEQMLLFSKHALDDMKRDNFRFKTTYQYSTDNWRKIIRDERNVHDDYTPLDIWPSSDNTRISITKPNTFGFFEDVIQFCMNTNWHIQNFNDDIRSSRHYSYHIDRPKEFEKFLNADLTEIEKQKDNMVRGHYEFFQKMKVTSNKFWAYNTEYIDTTVNNRQYDGFITLAAGVIPWLYLSKLDFANNTLVHFVDISEPGIEFQKWFLKNYVPNEFNTWSDVVDRFLEVENHTAFQPIGNAELSNDVWEKNKKCIDDNWSRIKNFQYKFEVADLIRCDNALHTIRTCNSPLVWFSNIFRYHATFEKNYNNDDDLQNYLNRLIHANRHVNWTGASPDNNKLSTGMNSLFSSNKIFCQPYNIPSFNSQLFMQEIQKLEDLNLFTDHRGSNHPGWSSFVIHGIGYNKTEGYERYGYKNDRETPYDWTAEALKHCPNIVEYFKQSGIKKRYHRLRIMKLAPKGYISIHDDDPQNFKRQWALNIAINNPDKCEMHFWNDDFEYAGQVPWAPEKAFLIRIHWKHMVMNLSNTTRYHIIVHGED